MYLTFPGCHATLVKIRHYNELCREQHLHAKKSGINLTLALFLDIMGGSDKRELSGCYAMGVGLLG